MNTCSMCGDKKKDMLVDTQTNTNICFDCIRTCSEIMKDGKVKDEKVVNLMQYKKENGIK